MSKPLPDCHHCGETVKRKARIIFDFHGEKFAWHTDTGKFACTKQDPAFDLACKAFKGEIPEKTAVLELFRTRKNKME